MDHCSDVIGELSVQIVRPSRWYTARVMPDLRYVQGVGISDLNEKKMPHPHRQVCKFRLLASQAMQVSRRGLERRQDHRCRWVQS